MNQFRPLLMSYVARLLLNVLNALTGFLIFVLITLAGFLIFSLVFPATLSVFPYRGCLSNDSAGRSPSKSDGPPFF